MPRVHGAMNLIMVRSVFKLTASISGGRQPPLAQELEVS